jgi:hypothetical protein
MMKMMTPEMMKMSMDMLANMDPAQMDSMTDMMGGMPGGMGGKSPEEVSFASLLRLSCPFSCLCASWTHTHACLSDEGRDEHAERHESGAHEKDAGV